MANQSSRRQGEQSTSMTRPGEEPRGLSRRQYQDPFSWRESMFERMQREFFGPTVFNAMTPFGGGDVGREGGMRVPRMQVRDAGEALELMAELPGIDGENVRVELDDDLLRISGEAGTEQEAEGGRTQRHVSFYREISLPDGLDTEQVESSFRNGVLTLRFPKRQPRRSTRQIPINTTRGGRQDTGQATGGEHRSGGEPSPPSDGERAA